MDQVRPFCRFDLPSVLGPLEKTFLLNPKHRDKIATKDMSVLILDPRLK
jgi:hypothetical protein